MVKPGKDDMDVIELDEDDFEDIVERGVREIEAKSKYPSNHPRIEDINPSAGGWKITIRFPSGSGMDQNSRHRMNADYQLLRGMITRGLVNYRADSASKMIVLTPSGKCSLPAFPAYFLELTGRYETMLTVESGVQSNHPGRISRETSIDALRQTLGKFSKLTVVLPADEQESVETILQFSRIAPAEGLSLIIRKVEGILILQGRPGGREPLGKEFLEYLRNFQFLVD